MPLKPQIKRLLKQANLWDTAIYVYEGHVKGFSPRKYGSNFRYRIQPSPDGLPIPPVRLIWLVIGSTEIAAFFESGNAHVHQLMLPLLARNNCSMTQFDAVLDFGCGCGRIMRHWQHLKGVELWGMDYNPVLVEWCRHHLPFAEFRVNQLEPPLPCEAEHFDFIYARSIFTHLTESLQEAWLQELRRVLKPNGTLLFTVSGDRYAHLLLPDELEQYQDGRLVVRDATLAGENACASFHPPAYVDYFWPQHGFEVFDFLPGGQVHYSVQDTYLARKRSSVANGAQARTNEY